MQAHGGGAPLDGDPAVEQEAPPDAVPAVGIWARRYLLEPGDGPWYDIVRTLREALGDDETYDLLRAIEIRFRTSGTK